MHARVESLDVPFSHFTNGSMPTPDRPSPIPQDHFKVTFTVTDRPSSGLQMVMADMHEFATAVSQSYGAAVLSWMDHPGDSGREVHNDLVKHVTENGKYMPSFTFYDQTTAADFFNRTKMALSELTSDELLMVFDIPPPLSTMWWHSFEGIYGKFAGEQAKGTEENYTPLQIKKIVKNGEYIPFPFWGDAYNHLRNVFWDHLDIDPSAADPTFENVVLQRLNAKKNHKPLDYYYVFKVSPIEDVAHHTDGIIYLYQPLPEGKSA